MQSLHYVSATSVDEVIDLLSSRNEKVFILSGGTDLLVQLREGRRKAELLVDVKNIPDLTTITYDEGSGLRVGAAVSCFQICQNPFVMKHYPGLVDAIQLIGGVQIQNRASLGGNLCNASPAADSIPALIVHEATCMIAGPNGTREMPVEQFCVAPGRNALHSGELLAAVNVPVCEPNFGAHFLRFIPRNEMDIAVAGAGASVMLDEGKSFIISARIALGAVAPTPLLVEEAGAFLAGKAASAETFREAAKIAQAAAHPISDLRGTIEQRSRLCGVLVRRALEKAVERARTQ